MDDLTLIASVKPGETIDIEARCCLLHNSWTTWLWRREDRTQLLSWLNKVFNEEISYLEQMARPDLRRQQKEAVLHALTGVRNLVHTYREAWGKDITGDLNTLIKISESRLFHIQRDASQITPIIPIHNPSFGSTKNYGRSADSCLDRYMWRD